MMRGSLRGWTPFVLVLLGCGADPRPVYQDQGGFRITLPADWVERARGDALSPQLVHKQAKQPLPPLQSGGKARNEQLLVRYDRVTSGHLGWLRVSVVDVSAATALKAFVAARSPGPSWKREGEIEEFELAGWPAARLAWLGRWSDQDYVCETAAIRKGDAIYFIAGAVPAADSVGREQIRQAIGSVKWQ